MSRAIPLVTLRSAIVDDDDYARLKDIEWYISVSRGKMYARRQTRKSRPVGETWMHRIIARTPVGRITHHKNGNTLDNRKINLQVMSQKSHEKLCQARKMLEKNPRKNPAQAQ